MEFTKDIEFNTNLTEDKICKISYNGILFKNNSDEVIIVFGYGENWEHTTEKRMNKNELNFSTEIKILENYDTFNFCFRNSNYEWDNNGGCNYISPIFSNLLPMPENDDIVLNSTIDNSLVELLNELFSVKSNASNIDKIESELNIQRENNSKIKIINIYNKSSNKKKIYKIKKSEPYSKFNMDDLVDELFSSIINNSTSTENQINNINSNPIFNEYAENAYLQYENIDNNNYENIIKNNKHYFNNIYVSDNDNIEIDSSSEFDNLDNNIDISSGFDNLDNNIDTSPDFDNLDNDIDTSSYFDNTAFDCNTNEINKSESNTEPDFLYEVIDLRKNIENEIKQLNLSINNTDIKLFNDNFELNSYIKDFCLSNSYFDDGYDNSSFNIEETQSLKTDNTSSTNNENSNTSLVLSTEKDNTFTVSPRKLSKFYFIKKKIKLAFYKALVIIPKFLKGKNVTSDNN